MPKRRNAGLGMARVTELVHEVAMDYQPDAVGAVGHMEVYPELAQHHRRQGRLHHRHPLARQGGARRRWTRASATASRRSARRSTSSFEIEQVGHFDPVTFDEGCVKAVRDAAERLGYTHRNIVSGAGHDACWINRVAPTAMVMCPCVDGLSHNEAEDISKEWAAAGATCCSTRWWRRRGSWSDRVANADNMHSRSIMRSPIERHTRLLRTP